MSGLRRVALAGTICLTLTLTLTLCGAAAAGAAPVSSGHSGWSWALPTPQGQSLAGVTFDGSTGYAVGNFGTVLQSADGGQTWSGLPSGTTSNLSIVQELDPNTVIVGGGCALRESTNGGQTFTPMPINPSDTVCSSELAAISFSSATTGYVLLASGQVLSTTNGGATVTAKTRVPLPSGSVAATGMTFTSPTTGFATTSAGAIDETTDGGNSWTQVTNVFARLNGIEFVNPQTAFAFGIDTLLKSTDGGTTWTKAPLALPSPSFPFPSLTGIACTSATQCLISTGTNSLIRTSDGGQTGSLVTPADQTLSAVAFTTGTGVVAVGAAGTTVLSANGGAQFPTLVSGGPGVALSSGTEQPLVAGGAPGSAYLLGKAGQLDATTNGGADWSLEQTPTNANVGAGAFPTTSTGYVTTSDRVLRKTTDGGNSWSSLDATVTNRTQVVATSASTVMLVGPRGIRRSTNGGQTFVKLAGRVQLAHGRHGRTVASLSLTDAAMHGPTVFAWGFNSAYESTNQGLSWRVIALPRKTRIRQLSFVSPTTGYALDAAGDVLYTTNRGAAWRKLVNVGTTAITDISFSSAKRGVLAINSLGTVLIDALSTTNGGQTWQPQVIDGGGAGLILASPNVNYFANISPGADPFQAVFTTVNAGASPKPSRLKLSLGTNRVTAKALRNRHGQVTIRGRLSPVTSPGEPVLLSFRSRQTGGWTFRPVTVASNGAFQATVSKLKATTDFVADSTGDGTYGGAQGYARLTVK
jgi:photosystem II stability/assembly factor-like uncharacterized protein